MPFGDINIFEGRVLLRDILHLTPVTFETTNSSTVAEPFIDFWAPNALLFMIAWYNLLQFDHRLCTHTNFTSSLESCTLIRKRHSKQGAPRIGSIFIFFAPNKAPLWITNSALIKAFTVHQLVYAMQGSFLTFVTVWRMIGAFLVTLYLYALHYKARRHEGYVQTHTRNVFIWEHSTYISKTMMCKLLCQQNLVLFPGCS